MPSRVIEQPNKDEFVRWAAKDEQGPFTHMGVVLDVQPEAVLLGTEYGEMVIQNGDGVFHAARKPKGFELSKRTTIEVDEEDKPKRKKTKRTRRTGPSKLDACRAFLKDYVEVNGMPVRKVAIGLLMENCDCTFGGASTYFNTIKKELA